jgi:site-specific DNA-methyltransferase (adenine-specific)
MGQRVISKNTLFYGDNLTILRDYLADETIDLIYLDPPFNSNRDYNVLYKDESGAEAEAQIVAFEDTWHWNQSTETQYRELSAVGDDLARLLDALVTVVGRNQMMAYLVMMAARLVELHRVLKPTGSLYLHCDPTASHYLKLVLDCIFGSGNFRNEIIWKRNFTKKGSQFKMTRLANNVDIILFYGKSDKAYFKTPKVRLPSDEFEQKYNLIDENGKRFKSEPLELPKMMARPNLVFEFMGYTPLYGWMMTKDKLEELQRQNKIYITKNGKPRRKNFLEEYDGTELDNIWVDISPLGQKQSESLGYPTQKPIALLERIIQASSNPGEVVLDPFCGCGTAVHAAHKLKRIWVGIDITSLATSLIKSRLYDAFKIEAKTDYDLIGEPVTVSDAQHLAKQDRYQFQWWALGLLPARPYGGQGDSKTGKKGADKGIDGIITFQDSKDGADKRIIVQVKSGKVSSRDLRDLHGTIEREPNAVMGVFLTLEPPSKNMEIEQMEIGYYHSETFHRDYPKLQIFTIEQLLTGAKVKFPGTNTTLKRAQPEQPEWVEQSALL